MSYENIVSIPQALKQLKDSNPTQFYYTKRIEKEYLHSQVNSNYIFGLYNKLLINFKNIVTREKLTDNKNNFVTYAYTIDMSKKYEGIFSRRYEKEKQPTYLIITGVHGHERKAVLSAYRFIYDLLYENNIPQSFTPIIKIVPIVCTYGFDRYISETENGDININRNFDTGNWGNGTSGPSPASEKETQAIQKWLQKNNNADLFIDYHNSGSLNEIAVILGDSTNTKTNVYKQIAQNGVDKVIPFWKNIIGYPETNIVDYYDENWKLQNGLQNMIFSYQTQLRLNGSSICYAQEKVGIPSFSFESPSFYGTSAEWEKTEQDIKNQKTVYYQAEPISCGSEILGNILLEIYTNDKEMVNIKAVLYDKQYLTEEQKKQARENIGVVSQSEPIQDDTPQYIKEAANEVIDKITALSSNPETNDHRFFNLIAISDFHYNDYDGKNKQALINASKAIAYIKDHVNIDAIATLGDNMQLGNANDRAVQRAHQWSREINEILKKTEDVGIINFRTPGNHDRIGAIEQEEGQEPSNPAKNYLPDSVVHNYITGYNKQLTYNNIPVGYGYHDFTHYKLRVILLNTAEVEGHGRFDAENNGGIGGGFRLSTVQLQWLMGALDLSKKIDANEWQILLLSHHSPDESQAWLYNKDYPDTSSNKYILPNILNAYMEGLNYSTNVYDKDEGASTDTQTVWKKISYNFYNKNQAQLIASIHGHWHTYTYDKIYLGAKENNGKQIDLYQISTPTSQTIKPGYVSNRDNNGKYYGSTMGTATETAFCIYSIDLDAKIIHAIHYGAGLDRTIEYKRNVSNQSILTLDGYTLKDNSEKSLTAGGN